MGEMEHPCQTPQDFLNCILLFQNLIARKNVKEVSFDLGLFFKILDVNSTVSGTVRKHL